MPRLRERHQRVSIIVAPAIEVTLQKLPGSAPTVAMLTPETRARLPKWLLGTIVDHQMGHPEIDVVSGNDSISRLRWNWTSEER
jgi:hypothetical protein